MKNKKISLLEAHDLHSAMVVKTNRLIRNVVIATSTLPSHRNLVALGIVKDNCSVIISSIKD